MSWRFRRSVKIAPGVKLNFSKHGVSTSFGVRGAHVTVGKDHVTRTVGIPGTGVYNTKTYSAKGRPSGKRAAQPVAPVSANRNAAWYSGYGLTFIILGALLLFVGLLVCIVMLPFGIFCVAFGSFLLWLGIRYRRRAKKMKDQNWVDLS